MILQALNNHYQRRLDRDPNTPVFGYAYAPIHFCLVLNSAGQLVDVDDVRVQAGRKLLGRQLLVPKDFEDRTSGDAAPRAFWDNCEWVLGSGSNSARAKRRSANFAARHRTLLQEANDPGAKGLLSFLMQWNAEMFASIRYAAEMDEKSNLVFRLDGQLEYLHERPALAAVWHASLASESANSAQCLITGKVDLVARIHPLIKHIAKPGQPVPKLVAFDKDSTAFDSYHKKQGANAPVTEQAAFAYSTALNALLDSDRNHIEIGDATTVFWADADEPSAAEAAERAAGMLFTPQEGLRAEAESSGADRLRTEIMERISTGKPLAVTEFKLDPSTRFYILGLSPNAARLSVRYWEATTLGALGAAFHQHWRDMRIDTPPPRGDPPSIPSLVLRTAPARRDKNGNVKFDFDDTSPLLAGELMRAVLGGHRYPGSLLSTLVMRIRTDGVLDRNRISLIKACIARAMRLDGRLPQEDYLVRTDPDDPNPARRLGRLFAVLERAQIAALGDDINTTIKDKFLGAAAATPNQVFVGLVKNAQQHHVKRLRNGHSDAKWIKDTSHARSVGYGIERDIGKLVGSFEDGMPSQLSIEEQGLFFVGYYQERFGGRPDVNVGAEPVDQTDAKE